MNPVIDLLKSHRSIRKFTDQPVEQAVIEQLVQAGQAAATSSFIQACTVIQISNPDSRAKLAEYAGGQAYVASAPQFLVFCADMKRHQLACGMHDAEMQSGYTEQFLTASLDCALFAQNLVVAAESLGLGAVYIGGLRNKIAEVADLLNLPELVYPVFGLCLGYPDQNPEVKPRLPLSMVLKQERYDDSADAETLADYDKLVREYYQTRTGGTKDMSWSEQISGMLVKEARPHMLPFLQQRGFLEK
ncbi:oxygen-insensitive NADPH nitroreductase [Marinobacterium arenosum]|uniref:oxygen-insensitive NADPH nitroreductase n=1 Tax=Marinobacterium arenosum TaxID=2862496 RepID=UPI001C951473|nr:oxygen-insensitive NADPH nitroreductase [Marinobacterium arenosum]MBY4678323.1 oxygen-insensitive NADPH nitroreductase [Marinobacterium arenosum]